MKFGIIKKKKLTGADLYVRIMQICAILPVLYLVYAPGYIKLFAERGVLTYGLEFGASAVPRAESLLISLLYRLTAKELIVCFAFPVFALAFGIVMNKLLREKYETARVVRIILLVLVAADLVLRLLPLHFNSVYPQGIDIAAFVLRLGCLALIAADLIADAKEKKQEALQAE